MSRAVLGKAGHDTSGAHGALSRHGAGDCTQLRRSAEIGVPNRWRGRCWYGLATWHAATASLARRWILYLAVRPAQAAYGCRDLSSPTDWPGGEIQPACPGGVHHGN